MLKVHFEIHSLIPLIFLPDFYIIRYTMFMCKMKVSKEESPPNLKIKQISSHLYILVIAKRTLFRTVLNDFSNWLYSSRGLGVLDSFFSLQDGCRKFKCNYGVQYHTQIQFFQYKYYTFLPILYGVAEPQHSRPRTRCTWS